MVDQILDRIWIGDQQDAENEEIVKTFTVIINLNTRESKKELELVKKYNVLYANFGRLFVATGYLSGAYDAGKKILIHCEAGIDKSPFVVAVFLSMELNISFAEAYGFVKERHKQTIEHYEWIPKVPKGIKGRIDNP